jgi:rhamnose transport system permease protein
MRYLLRRELAGSVTLVCFLLFLALTAPSFYSADNLRDLALSNISVLIVAAGATFVIILSEIDISVGSMFAVCAVLCGVLARAGTPMFLLPVAGMVVGALLGTINGALVSFLKAPSIVVTLATMIALREALNWITQGAWIQNLPPNFQWFGLPQREGEFLLFGITAVTILLMWWAARKLMLARAVYAVGSNSDAARLLGINTQIVVFGVFLLSGLLTGLAAALNSVRFSEVPPNTGLGLELKAIAAVVVGGTPITGGKGSLTGTVAGVALMGSIGPALTFLRIDPYWEKAFQGAVILIAVLFDALGSRTALSRGSRQPA